VARRCKDRIVGFDSSLLFWIYLASSMMDLWRLRDEARHQERDTRKSRENSNCTASAPKISNLENFNSKLETYYQCHRASSLSGAAGARRPALFFEIFLKFEVSRNIQVNGNNLTRLQGSQCRYYRFG